LINALKYKNNLNWRSKGDVFLDVRPFVSISAVKSQQQNYIIQQMGLEFCLDTFKYLGDAI